MNLLSRRFLTRIGRGTGAQVAVFSIAVALLVNLNALVDYFLYPDIPYLAGERLVLAGVTAVISGSLFGLLIIYVRQLTRALETIRTLEEFLPICSHCKRIRKPKADPAKMESWQPIESYLTERTASQLSHGICPECEVKFYAEPGLWRN